MMKETTKEWEQYQRGLDYQSKIHLLSTVDKNERFFSDRQWDGVEANGVPTPTLNVIKRVGNFKIASVMAEMVSMQYSAEGVSDDTQDPKEQIYKDAAKLMSAYARTQWERLKLDAMNEQGLLDALISGDMISFWYWDENINCGDGMYGEMLGELVDNVNYCPGDPNNSAINNIYGPVQPYIILAFRRQVKDVRNEAKDNGATKEEILRITADADTQNQAGDRAKQELDPDGDEGKCIVLLKLWDVPERIKEFDPVKGKEVKKGIIHHIYAKKVTRQVTVRDEWDTELHRYPVAMMNWGVRKNSANGEPEVTSMISNQIMINQMAAMIALWIKLHGFPKVVYDSSRIDEWVNDISEAVAVDGVDAGGVAGAAQYMIPGQISSIVMKFMEWFIQITKEMAGANEAVLGESKPTNTSAIIVLQKATAVPLNSVKRRFYQYIEDIGLIWLDFWLSKYKDYPNRKYEITTGDQKDMIPFDFSQLIEARFKLKIDVGPSSEWNEAATVQTLDNLLQQDLITFVEYLERLPKDMIPDKQELIDARNNGDEKLVMYELMRIFLQILPPEQREQIMSLPDEQQGEAIKQLVIRRAQGGEQSGMSNM